MKVDGLLNELMAITRRFVEFLGELLPGGREYNCIRGEPAAWNRQTGSMKIF